MNIVTDLEQYRCQPEKQVYCPHMDQAHTLLAEWLKDWDAGSDNAMSLIERSRALLKGKTTEVSHPPKKVKVLAEVRVCMDEGRRYIFCVESGKEFGPFAQNPLASTLVEMEYEELQS